MVLESHLHNENSIFNSAPFKFEGYRKNQNTNDIAEIRRDMKNVMSNFIDPSSYKHSHCQVFSRISTIFFIFGRL